MRQVGDVLAAAPNARVIVIGSTNACTDLASLMQAGVYGFVLEDATSDELLRTIRSVASGNHVWPTAIANALFSQRAHEGAREPARGAPARMTNREREVMSLIADGLRTREIAERLGVASFTVRAHVRNIMEKLDLHTRVQIAKYVFQERAGETPPVVPAAERPEIVHRNYRGIGSFDQYRAAEPRRIVSPNARWASLRHESNVSNGIKRA